MENHSAEKIMDEMILKVFNEKLSLHFKNLDIIKKYLESNFKTLPKLSEVMLNHYDVLLSTCTKFFGAGATVFTASIAINQSVLLNLNLELVRQMSLFVIIVSFVGSIFILILRSYDKKFIVDRIMNIDKLLFDDAKLRMKMEELRNPDGVKKIRTEGYKNIELPENSK